MQMFILMIDYGRDTSKAHGLEAIVQPELTRRNIVEQARDVLASDHLSIAFVKFVDGNFICDITDDILAEAALARSPQDLIEARNDHAQDHRKNYEAVS